MDTGPNEGPAVPTEETICGQSLTSANVPPKAGSSSTTVTMRGATAGVPGVGNITPGGTTTKDIGS